MELSTVFNLAVLYLLYCLINRHVRDRSVFSDLTGIDRMMAESRKNEEELKKRSGKGILNAQEDVPVLRKPSEGAPVLDLIPDKKEYKVETSFNDRRIGDYKSK